MCTDMATVFSPTHNPEPIRALDELENCMLINNCATLQALHLPFHWGPSSLKVGVREEENEGRVKVVRPPDQEVENKSEPVSSVQHQTEPVASFVPQNLSITMHILMSCFHPSFTTRSPPLPPLKRASLTFAPFDSNSLAFKINHQAFSFFSPKLFSTDVLLWYFFFSYHMMSTVQELGCCLLKR